MLTLVFENFFSKMRVRNDMLTVLEFAYLFAYLFSPTIRETLKQLKDTGFVYYTSSSSHYEFPEMMTLSLGELPSIPFSTSIEMAKKEDKTILETGETTSESLCVSWLPETKVPKTTLALCLSLPTQHLSLLNNLWISLPRSTTHQG